MLIYRGRSQKCVLVLIALLFLAPAALGLPSVPHLLAAGGQKSTRELETKLESQYAETQKLMASPPRAAGHLPADYHRLLREWQDDLAQSFVRAATTVEEILAINPPSREMWQERLETLRLYSQPISSPEERRVFGAGEVQTSARILETPLADYTDEARRANTHGDVRLRMVLAADGTVKNVFPIKSLGHGLTESAMKAARQIRFEPAIRNGKPASEFMTFVYEFEKGLSRQPYIPRSEF
jgi:TonB family protein